MNTAEILHFPLPSDQTEKSPRKSQSSPASPSASQGHNSEGMQELKLNAGWDNFDAPAAFEEPPHIAAQFSNPQTPQKQPSSEAPSLAEALSAKPTAVQTVDRILIQAGVDFIRKTPYHIKSGILNFFPSSGKITVDGVGLVKERGVENYIKACLQIQGKN